MAPEEVFSSISCILIYNFYHYFSTVFDLWISWLNFVFCRLFLMVFYTCTVRVISANLSVTAIFIKVQLFQCSCKHLQCRKPLGYWYPFLLCSRNSFYCFLMVVCLFKCMNWQACCKCRWLKFMMIAASVAIKRNFMNWANSHCNYDDKSLMVTLSHICYKHCDVVFGFI